MRNYEFVYIISPEIEEGNLESVTDRIGQLITNTGGQVLRLDSWGRRRLAYPIRSFTEGHYMVAQIQLEPGAISELRRGLSLTEELVRYLIVRTDEAPKEPAEAKPHEEPEEPVVEEPEPEDVEEEEAGG